jgi:hypothetical protein
MDVPWFFLVEEFWADFLSHRNAQAVRSALAQDTLPVSLGVLRAGTLGHNMDGPKLFTTFVGFADLSTLWSASFTHTLPIS